MYQESTAIASTGYSLGFFWGSLVPFLIVAVLPIVAMWKVYVKAGIPGWGVLVPIYNMYLLFKIAWNTKMCWIMLACSILPGILSGFVVGMDGNEALAGVLPLLMMAGVIATLVIGIINTVKLAKAFGKGGGFAVGLIFLSIIFYCILAFGKAQYIGPEGNVKEEAAAGTAY